LSGRRDHFVFGQRRRLRLAAVDDLELNHAGRGEADPTPARLCQRFQKGAALPV
jgi:hypothetical protein